MRRTRLTSFGLNVLLTTAIAPDPFTASFLINNPCRLPLNPSSGPDVPGTSEGAVNVRPPSRDVVNPSPRGRSLGSGKISQTR